MKHSYLFVLRGTLKGVRVMSWHEITEDDAETKATLFGMTINSKMNMGSGVLKISSNEAWTPELMEVYINSLFPTKREEFIKECKLDD